MVPVGPAAIGTACDALSAREEITVPAVIGYCFRAMAFWYAHRAWRTVDGAHAHVRAPDWRVVGASRALLLFFVPARELLARTPALDALSFVGGRPLLVDLLALAADRPNVIGLLAGSDALA